MQALRCTYKLKSGKVAVTFEKMLQIFKKKKAAEVSDDEVMEIINNSLETASNSTMVRNNSAYRTLDIDVRPTLPDVTFDVRCSPG